jgi:hypothetical protein
MYPHAYPTTAAFNKQGEFPDCGKVGIATGYGREDRDPEFESRKTQEFSLVDITQNDSRARFVSYPMII